MPKRSRSGEVRSPARVVAPTSVNGGRLSLMERAAGRPGGGDEDLGLCFPRQLADVLLEPARPDGPLDRLLVGGRRATDDAFGCHGYEIYSRAAPCRARRISSSVECVPGPTALSKRAASAGR